MGQEVRPLSVLIEILKYPHTDLNRGGEKLMDEGVPRRVAGVVPAGSRDCKKGLLARRSRPRGEAQFTRSVLHRKQARLARTLLYIACGIDQYGDTPWACGRYLSRWGRSLLLKQVGRQDLTIRSIRENGGWAVIVEVYADVDTPSPAQILHRSTCTPGLALLSLSAPPGKA